MELKTLYDDYSRTKPTIEFEYLNVNTLQPCVSSRVDDDKIENVIKCIKTRSEI